MEDIERNQSVYLTHNHPETCCCTKCLCQFFRLARYIPFGMISALYVWGAYTFIYFVILLSISQIWLKMVLIVLFLPLYLLSFISYLQSVFAAHRPISPEYSLPETPRLSQMNEDERNHYLENLIQVRNLPIFTRAFDGTVRVCTKCWVLKPDRAHHCSVCGRCICKMDHHCHWVSNCIAFDNYKFFILFLFYTTLLAIYVVITSTTPFLGFWTDNEYPGKFQIFFLVLFCFVFSISIIILLSYHIYLVIKNVSTLESYQRPKFKQCEYDLYAYDLGAKRNLISVFGDNKLLWFLPIFTSQGDGHYFQLPLLPGSYDKNNTTTNFDPSMSNQHNQHDQTNI